MVLFFNPAYQTVLDIFDGTVLYPFQLTLDPLLDWSKMLLGLKELRE